MEKEVVNNAPSVASASCEQHALGQSHLMYVIMTILSQNISAKSMRK